MIIGRERGCAPGLFVHMRSACRETACRASGGTSRRAFIRSPAGQVVSLTRNVDHHGAMIRQTITRIGEFGEAIVCMADDVQPDLFDNA